MKPCAVINLVGASKKILGPHTPKLSQWMKKNTLRTIDPIFPALTCSSQSTYLTGLLPRDHGIVGNGWYFPEHSQVWFWRQTNSLVQGEKVWEAAKKKGSELHLF